MLQDYGVAAAQWLRAVHWLAWGLALAGVLLALMQGRRPDFGRNAWRMALTGLWLAGASAWFWPPLYAAAVAQMPMPAGQWVAVATSADGWFPAWRDITQVHPDWVSDWRPDADVPSGARALRRGAWAAGLLGAAWLVALAGALTSRPRRRIAALAAGAGLALVAPYPPVTSLLTPATPRTFRQPDFAFSAERIAAGDARYQQLCAACHGPAGRGDGPLAARQPAWPSVLGPALFEHRHAGDLLWHVRHGARHGQGPAPTHDFAASLNDEQAWEILDMLRARAAGVELAGQPGWRQALPAPQFDLHCPGLPAVRSLADLRGQRVRISAVAGPNDSPALPDPRIIDVRLQPVSSPVPDRSRADCQAVSGLAWQAYAWIGGRELQSFAGSSFLVDRAGWLRAYQAPDASSGWSAPDTMCGPGVAPGPASGGLAETLQAIDAQPVDVPRFRTRF